MLYQLVVHGVADASNFFACSSISLPRHRRINFSGGKVMKKKNENPIDKGDGVERILNSAMMVLYYANEFEVQIRKLARMCIPKMIILCGFAFLCSTGLPASTSLQRAQWWQNRTEMLTRDKAELSSKPWSRWISAIVDENISLSREMAAEYDSVFTDKLSEETLQGQREALFYAAYLDYFLRNYSTESFSKKISQESDLLIREEIGRIFSTSDEAFIGEVYRMAVGQREIKNIQYQLYINEHQRQLASLKNGAPQGEDDAAKNVTNNFAYIEGSYSISYDAIPQTAAFKEVVFRVSLLKNRFDAVQSLFGAGGSEKRNLLFTERTDLLQADYLAAAADQPYDIRLFTAAAARLRAVYTPRLGSGDDGALIQEYHTAILSSLRAVAEKYKSSDENISAMHKIAERESQYVRCISKIKTTDSGAVLAAIGDNYNAAAASRAYLAGLYEKSTASPNGADGALNTRIFTETARHLRYISQSASPCAELRNALSGSSVKEYNKLRESDGTHLAELLGMISGCAKNHEKMTASLRVKDQSVLDRNELLLAQSEINRLERIVDKEIAALEELDLFIKFLQDYALVYSTVDREVGEKRLSETAKTSFNEGSLIPRLKDANIKDIEEQREARSYLKKTIANDIARLAALGELYKKKEMPLSFYPDQGKLWIKRQKIEQPAAITVASWQMNELNYTVVDKKAVALLKSRYERTTYTEPTVQPDGTHEIAEYGLSFSVPEGWEKKEYSKRKEGNLMNFENNLDGSMLMVGGYQPSMTESDIIDQWVSEQNLKVVKTGYSEKGSVIYLWKIASDGGNNVAKICAIHKDGKIIIVAGRAPKERYPFFQKRIDAVFDSIR